MAVLFLLLFCLPVSSPFDADFVLTSLNIVLLISNCV